MLRKDLLKVALEAEDKEVVIIIVILVLVNTTNYH